jgi:O-antigen ligase
VNHARSARLAPSLIVLGALAVAALAVATQPIDESPVIALGLIVGIPAAILSLRLDPAWLASGTLAMSVFSSHSGDAGLPFPPDRALLALTLLSLVIRGVREQEQARLPFDVVHWLMLAMVAYILISAAWGHTLTQHTALFHLIDRVGLIPFLFYYLAPRLFATERQRNILLGTLVVTGAYIGLTAWFETFHLRGLVFPKYILDESVGINTGEGRARGPFAEAVANGLSIYGCACASVIAFTRWKSDWRWIALGVAGICVVGSVFALTRAVWIGTAFGTIVALLVARETRRYVPALVTAMALAVVALFALSPQLRGDAEARKANSYPVWARLNSNAAAVRMVNAQPLFGYGWLRFPIDGPDYFRQAPRYPLTGTNIEVHNIYLGYAVELGLVGTLLYVLTFGLAVGRAVLRRVPDELRGWTFAYLAFALAYVVVANFGPVAYAFPNTLVWLLAGVITALPLATARTR